MSSLYYLPKTNQSVQSPRKPIVNVLNKFSLITFLLIVGFVGLLFPLDLSAQKIDREQLLKDIQILSADDMEGRKAGTAGGEKARQYLIGRFRDNHILSYAQGYEQPFSFNTFRSNERYENNVNLIGYIEGEIEDIIVVSAHYDHIGLAEDKIYNGADDNASGVSAMLAIAAYFKENKPRHTIVFAAFDAEEQGKKGAIYFVSKPPEELRKGLIRLNINMDMLSQNDKNELYASGTFHNPWLKPLLEEVVTPENFTLQFGHDRPEQGADDWTNSSDHGPFHKEGIPFIYFGVEDHANYHQATDTFENIHPDFYYNAASFVLDAVIHLDKVDLMTAPSSRN
ncbi:M20/M25/M40 family metallo-hydrolase [Peijinzhouia sedimentorum]